MAVTQSLLGASSLTRWWVDEPWERYWMEVSDRDNLSTRDNYHDWVLANEKMAEVLAAKGYHYQFVFARNAGHTDRMVKQQTLPQALEYVWQGYKKK